MRKILSIGLVGLASSIASHGQQSQPINPSSAENAFYGGLSNAITAVNAGIQKGVRTTEPQSFTDENKCVVTYTDKQTTVHYENLGHYDGQHSQGLDATVETPQGTYGFRTHSLVDAGPQLSGVTVTFTDKNNSSIEHTYEISRKRITRVTEQERPGPECDVSLTTSDNYGGYKSAFFCPDKKPLKREERQIEEIVKNLETIDCK